ncbi:hypothetical protein SBIUS_v1c04080 [Spiroplasma sp. BIUS-1]|nr:hypothetical protein SBIUS_v1c04080 [Spiroplasma sp. BIUS-1]
MIEKYSNFQSFFYERGYFKVEKLLKRINELAAIKKQRELTQSELEERTKLREEYIKLFRAGFEQQLENTVFVDENGNEIKRKKDK